MFKFNVPSLFSNSVLLLLCLGIPFSAYSGINDDAVVSFDFKTTGEDSQLSTVVDVEPAFYEVLDGEETKVRFDVVLTLTGAEDLVGFNCDLNFDSSKLKVINIHESEGDMNFDGRSNIADVLALAERFNEPTTENGYGYFDLDISGDSANVIDAKDIDALLPYVNLEEIYWTSNSNHDLTERRESVEIFEDPEVSNSTGLIDDIVVVLLSTMQPIPEGFGFDGDARIAKITFEVIGDISEGTDLTITDVMAIDEKTEVNPESIINGSIPQTQSVTITP